MFLLVGPHVTCAEFGETAPPCSEKGQGQGQRQGQGQSDSFRHIRKGSRKQIAPHTALSANRSENNKAMIPNLWYKAMIPYIWYKAMIPYMWYPVCECVGGCPFGSQFVTGRQNSWLANLWHLHSHLH